ncbi:lipocalin family protein [Endothiovibrio diazotrophicus]
MTPETLNFLKCKLPWILLLLFLLFYTFIPNKGLIGPIQLPRDDAMLNNQDVQWWYWTGHLESEDGRKFGFELVFFAFDQFIILKEQLVQAAVTDINGNNFHYGEDVTFFDLPHEIPNRFDLSADNKHFAATAMGGNGEDHITANLGEYAFDLQLKAGKKPVLHYAGGPHPYRFGGYTYYYSREAMEASGTLTAHGKEYKVSGTAWFDRQYGDLLPAVSQGWQWFAIELNDNRQLMLYYINGQKNDVENYASLTDAKGHTRVYGPGEFTIDILDHWTSPHTGCEYPSKWNIQLDDETFVVTPQVADQELRAKHGFWASPVYWEGASSVARADGSPAGQAYVELNGFCRGKMIDLKNAQPKPTPIN